MKRFFCSAMSLIFIVSFFGVAGVGQRPKPKLRKVTAKLERGPKVAARVRALRAADNRMRAALEAFEKNGHNPKIDEAVSISGKIEDVPVNVAVGKAHHSQTVTGDGVTVTFITVVDLYNEWQGTAIAEFYDATGALEEEYVADVVITRSEYEPSEWTARYDLKFEADGIGYINHRPGMFTNFILGTPILQQAAPLSLDPSQFASTDQMNAFYALYPEQMLYDVPPTGDGGGGEILPILPTRFTKPQRLVGPGILPGSSLSSFNVVGWSAAAREIGIRGTGVGVTCGVAGLLGAIGFGGCSAAGMSGVVVVAALNHLRIVRR